MYQPAASRDKLSKTATQKSVSQETFLKRLDQWFDLSLAFSTSLKNMTDRDATREKTSLLLAWKPIKNLRMSTEIMFDTNDYKNIYYQPDFYYTLTYASYEPNSCGFSYSNYGNNQFQTTKYSTGFKDGTWELNCRRKLYDTQFIGKIKYKPSNSQKFISLSGEKKLLDTTFSFEYDRALHYDQHKLELAAKTTFYKNFFLSGSLFFYSDPDLQEVYESDYSLAFGWNGENISIGYSNEYMQTRWPGRKEEGVSLLEGQIFVKVKF